MAQWMSSCKTSACGMLANKELNFDFGDLTKKFGTFQLCTRFLFVGQIQPGSEFFNEEVFIFLDPAKMMYRRNV
jgi:hypothetical protein